MLSRGCGRRHCGRDGSGGRARHSASASARRSTSRSSPSTRRCLRSPSLSSRPSWRCPCRIAPEAGADRVERIDEIGPARRRRGAGGAEGAGLAVPAAIGVLRVADLVGAHPVEIIVAGVELADMVEAEPAPLARPVEAGALGAGRAELAGRVAAGLGAMLRPPFDPSVEPRLPSCPRSPILAPFLVATALYRRE